MKKFLSLLLCAALALSCLPSFATEVAVSDDVPEYEKIYTDAVSQYDVSPEAGPSYIQSLFLLGGNLYEYQYSNTAWMMESGSDTWREVAVKMPDDYNDCGCQMYCTNEDGSAVYGLLYKYDNENGEPLGYEIARYTAGENGSLVFTPGLLVDFGINMQNSGIQAIAGTDDTMYVVINNYMENSVVLEKLSMDAGNVTTLDADPFIQSLVYSNGSLFALCLDTNNVWSDTEGKILPYITRIDPTSGETVSTITLPRSNSVTGLAADDSHLYYQDFAGVYCVDMELKQAQKVAYIPAGTSRVNATGVIFGGKYCTPGNVMGVYSVNPDDMQKTVLTISGGYYDEAMVRGYMKLHPDVAIVNNGKYFYSADSYRSDMQSGKDSSDIYQISLTGSGFSALMGKGYLADLSVNQEIAAAVSRMYPNLSKYVEKDGKIYAVPFSIESQGWSWCPAAFERIGLTEDDVPKTILDLLDFIEKYMKEYRLDYPDVGFFEYGIENLSYSIMSMAMLQQMCVNGASGAGNKLDTPAMIAIMDKLDQMKPIWDEIDRMNENGSGNVMYRSDSSGLFDNYYSILPGNRYSWGDPVKFMPLSMDESTPAYFNVSISTFVVNPYSPNQAAAMDFLAYVMKNLDDVTSARLMADVNEPVVSEDYTRSYQINSTALEKYEAGILTAPEEEKPMWQMYIDSINDNLTYIEAQKWRVSPEEIEEYAEIEPYLTVVGDAYTLASGDQTQKLLQRYMDGQIPGSQFLKEFSRIMEMAAMENQ